MLEEGAIAPSLFDEKNLVEISSSEFPAERLFARRNPLLANTDILAWSKKAAQASKMVAPFTQPCREKSRASTRLLGEEYGMDVINDLNGDYVCTFIKRKIRMRAGQTDQAVTVRDDRLEMIGQRIGEKLGHIGLLDCDAFTTKHGCYVIDMNPRIGGGYPFSHIAGANLPAALVAWASGQAPNPAWFNIEPDVAASRYDSLLITNRKAPEIVWSNAEQKLQRLSLKA